MYLRLRTQGVLEAMAFVCQQRMWAEQAMLVKGGMPVTDAREIAERDQLMLDPESEDKQEGFSDLPPQLQGQSQEQMQKAWSEMERLGLLEPHPPTGMTAVQQAMNDGKQAILRSGL